MYLYVIKFTMSILIHIYDILYGLRILQYVEIAV